MASETKNENIMLTGQTAYFKKNGSMVNRGTLNLANALSARSYAEGYIGPNSVLHGTDLALTSEYKTCANSMKSYLGEHWTEKEGERSIITNSNVIKELLQPGCDNIQTIIDGTIKPYTKGLYVRSNSTNNTQYINTGIIPTNHYVVCKARLGTSTAGQVLFGTDATGFGMEFYGSSKWEYATGTETKLTTISTGYSSIFTFTYNKDNKFMINDYVVDDNIHASNSTYPMYLFSRPDLGDSLSANAYIYSFKIYECGTDRLVRDYIPAKDNKGVYCFYENVEGKLCYSSGTTVFSSGGTAGTYKYDLEYAETTNNSYVTMYGSSITTSITGIGFELDFMPMEDFNASDTDGEKYILCAATTSAVSVRICSYPGYPNGMIQIGTDGEMLDAKLQYGKRQKIICRNGVLTLPDGTTHKVTPSTTSANWRLGQSRVGREIDHAVVRIYGGKIYGATPYIPSDIKPILSNLNNAYFWNDTFGTATAASGNLKPGPRKES